MVSTGRAASVLNRLPLWVEYSSPGLCSEPEASQDSIVVPSVRM